MDDKRQILEKEIDLIQACINRMAQKSFIIKGWLIALATVILALLPEKIDIKMLCAIVVAITICFWYLDAFFLRLERLYRWKYEWVIKKRIETDEYQYDLNPMNNKMWLPGKDNKERQAPNVIRVMFTKSLVPLYGIIIGLSLLLLLKDLYIGSDISTMDVFHIFIVTNGK